MKLPDKKGQLVAYSNSDVLKKVLVEKGILAAILGTLFAGFMFLLGSTADSNYVFHIWGVSLTFRAFMITAAAIVFVAPQALVFQSYFFERGKRIKCTECNFDRHTDEIEAKKSVKQCSTCYHELD